MGQVGQRDHRRALLLLLGRQADFAGCAMYSPGGKAFLVLHLHDQRRPGVGSAPPHAGQRGHHPQEHRRPHRHRVRAVASLRGRSVAERARGSSPSRTPEHRDEPPLQRPRERATALTGSTRSFDTQEK